MRKSLLAGACVTAMWSFIAAPALAVTVTNVEVTQAIQTPTNTVKLIAAQHRRPGNARDRRGRGGERHR
jgi:uncharacterized protein YcfJ